MFGMNKKNKNIFVGTGISKKENPFEAGKEAVEMAINNMQKNGSKKGPDIGILFCSAKKYAQSEKEIKELVKSAEKIFRSSNPNCKWIGCTTAGEISNYGVTDETCVVMAIQSEYVHCGLGIGKDVIKNPQKAGENAIKTGIKDLKIDKYVSPYIQFTAMKNKKADELMKMNPFSILLLTPGASGNYPGMDSKIISAIASIIGSHTPIVGGAAGDDFLFKQTYQFANGETYKDAVVLFSFSLDVIPRFGVAHGCESTDKIAMVTEVDGKMVKTLNGKPAAETYMEMTGFKYDQIKGQLVAWAGTQAPFAIVDNEGRKWLKSPQMEINKGLLFFADIPKNTLLLLMKPTIEKTIKSAKEVIINEEEKTKEGLRIIFNCGGRKTYLKEDIKKEYEQLYSACKKTPFIGFYTYSEFGFSSKTTTNVINNTIVSFKIEDRLINEN